MNDADKTRFLSAMTGVGDYYNKTLSSAVIDIYWHGLKEFDLNAVLKALFAHSKNPDSGQYMPKVADIVKMIQGTSADSAQIAWSKVDRAVRNVGTYEDVVFDDPIIHRVIADMGGWILLGQKRDDEWPFVAREFENRYKGYKSRGETPEYPRVIQGLIGLQNASQGYKSQPPVLIGNREKANQVLLAGSSAPLVQIGRAGDLAPTIDKPKLIA